MIYTSRDIKDRVALGDDKYYITQLDDGRVLLTPAPDRVIEPGTDVNKELLQLIEDRITLLMNRVFNDLTANPFIIRFATIDALTGNGIWNASLKRLEC